MKPEELSKYYSQCKFFIHLADFDPHPCTIMEAILCGCFPIVSKSTGSNYLLTKDFIIENSDNFKEINEKIKNILNNEKKSKKILEKAKKQILTKEQSANNFKKAFNYLSSS